MNNLRTTPQGDSNPEWKQKVPVVSVLTRQLRGHLENSFFDVWVRGEISNLRIPASGHAYFVIKDATSQIKGVMFRNALGRNKTELDEGTEVIAHGAISVYEARGEYQIICDHIEPLGAGALQAKFEKLKAKLQKEGLFDAKHKQPLPSLPKRIGVITSGTGAAVRDILKVLSTRFHNREVYVLPVSVQGEKAAGEIAAAIERAQRWNTEQPEKAIEVLIVGRGGGSIEDLWPFNEEIVARALYQCPIPTISAVGHEIDFTIADFVADVRAPTPSAAAEMVVPEYEQLLYRVTQHQRTLYRILSKEIEQKRLHIGHLNRRLVDPRAKLAQQKEQIKKTLERLTSALKNTLQLQRMRLKKAEALIPLINRNLANTKNQYASLTRQLHQLSPLQVVSRGYSLTQKDGKLIRSVKDVQTGDTIQTRLQDGIIESSVSSRTSN